MTKNFHFALVFWIPVWINGPASPQCLRHHFHQSVDPDVKAVQASFGSASRLFHCPKTRDEKEELDNLLSAVISSATVYRKSNAASQLYQKVRKRYSPKTNTSSSNKSQIRKHCRITSSGTPLAFERDLIHVPMRKRVRRHSPPK